jgi:hypothetical protein
MSISTYDASVPMFVQILNCQVVILDKAAAFAEAKNIDAAVLPNARLYADMLPFKKQIQIMTDLANRATARLAALEIPSSPDTEETLGELKARVMKTLAFVKGAKKENFAGSETKSYEIPVGGENKKTMTGQEYLFHFVLPNFIFHATTAYGILRHSGVELGKKDFLQPPD